MMNFGELVHAIQTLNAEDAFQPRLSPEQWRMFATFLTSHQLKAGELLCKQGDNDRTVYFLEQGSLQVFMSPGTPGAAARVAIMRPGSICGEPGLFADGPRSANVEAMTPSVVWALRLPRFEEMAARVPAVALEVARAAGRVVIVRTRANMQRLTPST